MKEVFADFDKSMENLHLTGGCTAIVVLLIGNKLITSNIGDTRAIMSKNNGKTVLQLSYDHSPMNDYDRILSVLNSKKVNEEIIKRYFRINSKDETRNTMKKLPAHEKAKTPLISREQRKSRLFGTISVARGFGDFQLTVVGVCNIEIKPFLSCEPHVNITTLNEDEIDNDDILIIASDGVFDVLDNQDCIDKSRMHLLYNKPMISPIHKNGKCLNNNNNNVNDGNDEKTNNNIHNGNNTIDNFNNNDGKNDSDINTSNNINNHNNTEITNGSHENNINNNNNSVTTIINDNIKAIIIAIH